MFLAWLVAFKKTPIKIHDCNDMRIYSTLCTSFSWHLKRGFSMPVSFYSPVFMQWYMCAFSKTANETKNALLFGKFREMKARTGMEGVNGDNWNVAVTFMIKRDSGCLQLFVAQITNGRRQLPVTEKNRKLNHHPLQKLIYIKSKVTYSDLSQKSKELKSDI